MRERIEGWLPRREEWRDELVMAHRHGLGCWTTRVVPRTRHLGRSLTLRRIAAARRVVPLGDGALGTVAAMAPEEEGAGRDEEDGGGEEEEEE